MQQIAFATANFLERTFEWLLIPFGWLPSVAFTLIFVLGFFYWLFLQRRYDRQARERGTLA